VIKEGSTLAAEFLLPIDFLPSPRFDHLQRMTGPFGLWEHARYSTPRTEHGYCTDDNARALIVASRQSDPSPRLLEMARLYLLFIEEAALPLGGFHNRRSADGTWADQVGSDDSQGRAIWGLGSAAHLAAETDVRRGALSLFERQLDFASASPRANAFAVLGAVEVLAKAPGHRPTIEALKRWVGRIPVSSDPIWPWPEDRLAYDNARLPEALIAAASDLGDDALLETGIGLLDWLVSHQTHDGHYSFTPTGGWAPGEPQPGFDQQPVEAAAMADACARAWTITGGSRWRDRVLEAARWFVGANDGETIMYDAETGGCYDGLTRTGPNLNQGAESTLAALSTMQLVGTLT